MATPSIQESMSDYVPLYPGEVFNGLLKIERRAEVGEVGDETGTVISQGNSKYMYWGHDLETGKRHLCCFAVLKDRSLVAPSEHTPKELINHGQ